MIDAEFFLDKLNFDYALQKKIFIIVQFHNGNCETNVIICNIYLLYQKFLI